MSLPGISLSLRVSVANLIYRNEIRSKYIAEPQQREVKNYTKRDRDIWKKCPSYFFLQLILKHSAN